MTYERVIIVISCAIYLCKMENDIVVPSMPISYKRFADDNLVPRENNYQ